MPRKERDDNGRYSAGIGLNPPRPAEDGPAVPVSAKPAFTIVKQSQTAPQSDMSGDGPDSALKVQKASSGQAL
jgi:hypothetical protein